jgi:hypothetical protein
MPIVPPARVEGPVTAAISGAPTSQQQLVRATLTEAASAVFSVASATQGHKTPDTAPDKLKSSGPTQLAGVIPSAAGPAMEGRSQSSAVRQAANQRLRSVAIDAALDPNEVADKKTPAANPQAASLSTQTQSAPLAQDGSTLVPGPGEPALVASSHTPAAESREVPRSPLLPEPGAPALNTASVAHMVTDAASEMQMRVGIRTTAFGAVEIYTSVHQNQVGLSVHGERNMEHWFSTEVQSIESGLNDHRLHLTSVELDKSSTSLPTSTGSGSQQQQPQRHFLPARSFHSDHVAEQAARSEVAEPALARMMAWPAENRVSIHV